MYKQELYKVLEDYIKPSTLKKITDIRAGNTVTMSNTIWLLLVKTVQ